MIINRSCRNKLVNYSTVIWNGEEEALSINFRIVFLPRSQVVLQWALSLVETAQYDQYLSLALGWNCASDARAEQRRAGYHPGSG